MTLPPSDRRTHPRYPLAANLMFTYAGQVYPGSVHDLGKGGLSFWAIPDILVGESLTLSLTLIVGTSQAKLTTRGLVRWKQPSDLNVFRYGTAFGELSAAQLGVLAEFLGGTGEPPSSETA